jgi:hypothetical protein
MGKPEVRREMHPTQRNEKRETRGIPLSDTLVELLKNCLSSMGLRTVLRYNEAFKTVHYTSHFDFFTPPRQTVLTDKISLNSSLPVSLQL